LTDHIEKIDPERFPPELPYFVARRAPATRLPSSFGAKPVLVTFSLIGAACSLVIGWLSELHVALLLALVCIYGFAIIGDATVLFSAMTEAVPPSCWAEHLAFDRFSALARVPCRRLHSAWHST
jgi:MFS family permease